MRSGPIEQTCQIDPSFIYCKTLTILFMLFSNRLQRQIYNAK